MALLRYSAPWTFQPPEVVEVDWNNPLTHGLVFLAPMWPGQLHDIAGGKRATVTGALGSTVTKDGVFPLFSGTQYIDYGAFGAEFPAGPATVAWIQTPLAQSGFNTVMDLKPNGGVNSWLVYQTGGGGSYAFTFGRRASTGAANYNTTVGAPVNGDTRRFLIRSPSLDTATYTDYSLLDGLSGPLAPDGTAPYAGGTSTGMRIGAYLPSAGADYFDGAIGMVAIWKRQLSDAEASSYNANPWQIFAPQTIWVPVSAGGGPTPVGTSTETDAALGLSAIQIKAAGRADETDAALALSGASVAATGRADETDAALSLSAVQSLAAGVASETDAALALDAGASGAVGRADEADAALTLSALQVAAVGLAAEVDSALALTGIAGTAPGIASESDTAFALAAVQKLVAGSAQEVDTALALTPPVAPGSELALILKILRNRQELNPSTGKFTLYDDDGVTVLLESNAWADVAGTQPYSGAHLARIDALV